LFGQTPIAAAYAMHGMPGSYTIWMCRCPFWVDVACTHFFAPDERNVAAPKADGIATIVKK
jgi:hypothetical protein